MHKGVIISAWLFKNLSIVIRSTEAIRSGDLFIDRGSTVCFGGSTSTFADVSKRIKKKKSLGLI